MRNLSSFQTYIKALNLEIQFCLSTDLIIYRSAISGSRWRFLSVSLSGTCCWGFLANEDDMFVLFSRERERESRERAGRSLNVNIKNLTKFFLFSFIKPAACCWWWSEISVRTNAIFFSRPSTSLIWWQRCHSTPICSCRRVGRSHFSSNNSQQFGFIATISSTWIRYTVKLYDDDSNYSLGKPLKHLGAGTSCG